MAVGSLSHESKALERLQSFLSQACHAQSAIQHGLWCLKQKGKLGAASTIAGIKLYVLCHGLNSP